MASCNRQLRRLTTTVLKNGIRVATEPNSSHFVSVGCYIQTGSRYELHPGATFMMDRIAFQSTKNLSSSQLVSSLEKLGGLQCNSGREHAGYQASCFPSELDRLLYLMSEIILRPSFLENELETVKQQVRYELMEKQWRSDLIIPEYLHQTAYRKPGELSLEINPDPVGLGRPFTITSKALSDMTIHDLAAHRNTWYTPDRMVLTAVGVNHLEFVDLVSTYFGEIPPSSPETKLIQKSTETKSVYVGGTRIIDTTHLPQSPNPDDMKLSHVQISFEGVASTDPDIYAMAMIGSLLGGGGSFSAGGPGKGMYTRLYRNVLNKCGWIEECSHFVHGWSDTSMFGISASVPPDIRTHYHVLPVLCEQFTALGKIQDEEFERARKMLMSSLLMGLETQNLQIEELGRRVLSGSVSVLEVCERIKNLQPSDLERVSRRILFGEVNAGQEYPGMTRGTVGSGPTVLFQGPLYRNDQMLKTDEILSKFGLSK